MKQEKRKGGQSAQWKKKTIKMREREENEKRVRSGDRKIVKKMEG